MKSDGWGNGSTLVYYTDTNMIIMYNYGRGHIVRMLGFNKNTISTLIIPCCYSRNSSMLSTGGWVGPLSGPNYRILSDRYGFSGI
jgi:hypothetical protein